MKCLFELVVLFSLLAMSAVTFAVSDASAIRKSPQYCEARAKGAVANLRIQLNDESGDVVSNANVHIEFDMISYSINVDGQTDSQGICLLSGKTRGNAVTVFVSKEGYYPSSKRLCLASMTDPHAVAEGVWQPSPLLVQLVLKKRCSPILSPGYGGAHHLPQTNEWYSFDFVANDWVVPYGRGKIPDVEFKVNWTGEDPMKWSCRDLEMRFLGDVHNGGCLVAKHTESEFPYSYKANPVGVYLRHFCDSTSRDEVKFGMLDDSQDFVFRFRSETDESGHLVACNYGRIRQLDYGHNRNGEGVVIVRYDYNRNPNDTNLEFQRKIRR